MGKYKREEFDLINSICIFGCPYCNESDNIEVIGMFPVRTSINNIDTEDDLVTCSNNLNSRTEIIPIRIICNNCDRIILSRKVDVASTILLI